MARDLTNAVNESTRAEPASTFVAVCAVGGDDDDDGCGVESDSPAAFLTSVTQPGTRSTGSADRARASTPAAAVCIKQSTASGEPEHWDAALTTANGTTAAPATGRYACNWSRSDATTTHTRPDRIEDDDMFVFVC